MSTPPRSIFLIVAGMLLLAIAPLPYGYYQLLRLVVGLAGAWIAYDYWRQERQAPAIVFGLMALLFNPVIPVHLDRETWTVINVLAAAVFATGALRQLPWRAGRSADS